MPFLNDYFLKCSEHSIKSFYHNENVPPIPPDPTEQVAALITAEIDPKAMAKYLCERFVIADGYDDNEKTKRDLTAALTEYLNGEKT